MHRCSVCIQIADDKVFSVTISREPKVVPGHDTGEIKGKLLTTVMEIWINEISVHDFVGKRLPQ
jgi:hypothetical protein